jgi:hypothetical protein
MNRNTTLSFKSLAYEKNNANKQRTNLLLLVDKELRCDKNKVKINSLTEKEIRDQNDQNYVVEIQETYLKNNSNLPTNYSSSQSTTIGKNSFNLYKDNSASKGNFMGNRTYSLNASSSNMSVQTCETPHKITSLTKKKITKSFSSLSPFENVTNVRKNINFILKKEKEVKKDLIYDSFKYLKNLAEQLKISKKSKSPNSMMKLFDKTVEKSKKNKNFNFKIDLKSMHISGHSTEFEVKNISISKNSNFSFEEM